MTDINIDRMSVTVSDMSGIEGERLAHMIAEKLAKASGRVAESEKRESVQVNAQGGPGLDQLAERIVDDLVRQLNRTV